MSRSSGCPTTVHVVCQRVFSWWVFCCHCSVLEPQRVCLVCTDTWLDFETSMSSDEMITLFVWGVKIQSDSL